VLLAHNIGSWRRASRSRRQQRFQSSDFLDGSVAAHGGVTYSRDAPDDPRAAYLDALTPNDCGLKEEKILNRSHEKMLL
jgi:hypothetical protein